jgi:hypothetical protein
MIVRLPADFLEEFALANDAVAAVTRSATTKSR